MPPPTSTRKPFSPFGPRTISQADIVEGDGGAIFGGAGDGDLELARQPAELRMQRRPLAQDLAPGTRVLELVMGGAGKRIGGDVAHAIAAGLDAVHLDLGERRQHVGNVDELHPVELQILPRGEMAVAAIPFAPDHGELTQLARRQHAIGNGDAQHIGVELEIESVPQAQRTELVLGQRAGQAALDLIRETPPRARARTRGRTHHSGTSYQSFVSVVRWAARMRSRTERGSTLPSSFTSTGMG